MLSCVLSLISAQAETGTSAASKKERGQAMRSRLSWFVALPLVAALIVSGIIARPAIERAFASAHRPKTVVASIDGQTASDTNPTATEVAERTAPAASTVTTPATKPASPPTTKPSRGANTVTTADGKSVAYRGVFAMVATAYDATPESNGTWGPYAAWNGERLAPGMIAVDPSVIPLGTRVYVTGYSCPLLPPGGFIGIAADTGSAIKGNRVDIYLEGTPKQVADFGFQNVKVYVLADK